MAGRAALGQRFAGMASVRGGESSAPLSHVCGNGGGTRIANPADGAASEAGVGILPDLVDIAVIGLNDQLVHIVVIIAVFRGVVDQHLADPFAVLSGKVSLQCRPELGGRELFLFEDKLFNGGERIGQVGNAHLQAADVVVNSAAFFQRQAAADAVFTQGGAQHIRHVLLQHHVTGVLNDDAVPGKVPDDHVPGVGQLLIGGHVSEMAGALYKVGAALRVGAVVHGNQQRLGEVQKAHAGAAVAPLAGYGSFHTADGTVVVGVLFLYAAPDERGNDDLIIVECGHPEAQLDHLNRLIHKLIRQPGMIAHRQVGLGQMCLCNRTQNQVGHGVDGILMLRRLAADGHILVEGRPCTELGVTPGADFVDGEGLQPEVGHELAGGILCDDALFQILLVIRPQILIHSSVGEGMSVRLNLKHKMRKPQRLHSLAQRFGRLIGHFTEDSCHLLQLGGALRLRLRCERLCQVCVACGKIPHGLNDNQDSLVEIILLQVFIIGQVQCIHAGDGSALVGLQPLPQYGFVSHGNMRIPGSQVALRLDNAEIVKNPALRRNGGKPLVQQRVVLPEGIDAAKLLLRLFRDGKDVSVPLFKFIQLPNHPVHRVLGEDGCSPVGGRLIACQQGFRLNINGHLFQNILQHIRPAQHNGLVGMQAVALGCQKGALSANPWLNGQQCLAIGIHALRQCAEA